MSRFSLFAMLVALGLLSACGGGGGTAGGTGSLPTPSPAAITATVSGTLGAIGSTATITATQQNYSGPFTYTSSDGSVISLAVNTQQVASSPSGTRRKSSAASSVSSSNGVTAIVLVHGTVSITISGGAGQSAAPPALTNIVTADSSLPVRGLRVEQFEERGSAVGYWNGQMIQSFNNFDPVVNSTVSAEVSLQLDQMAGMGVNTIVLELRAADGSCDPTVASCPFVPPTCPIPAVLGLHYPQPTTTELGNLTAFFNLVNSKGMKVALELTNTHMDEQPPSDNTTWLNAILTTIGSHPAFYLALFDGNEFINNINGTPSCGVPAEAPLWLGMNAPPAQYVKWAIGYANSLGIPFSKLSAESIVGSYIDENSPNLTSPIAVMKEIFDSLGVPDNQRTYALSFYEHTKCSFAGSLPCTDASPDVWADQTMQSIFQVIGRHGARAVATEFGDSNPVSPSWPSDKAADNLIGLMEKYGVDGGGYWLWVNTQTSDDSNSTQSLPVKLRGTSFTYTAVQPVLAKYYTAH